MKYRRLTNEELAELEKEFVRFLVSNTVTSEDWEKINEWWETWKEDWNY